MSVHKQHTHAHGSLPLPPNLPGGLRPQAHQKKEKGFKKADFDQEVQPLFLPQV